MVPLYCMLEKLIRNSVIYRLYFYKVKSLQEYKTKQTFHLHEEKNVFLVFSNIENCSLIYSIFFVMLGFEQHKFNLN